MPPIRSLLVATALAVAITSAPAPSSAAPVEGESGVRALPSARAVTPGYHYGATFTQVLPAGELSRGVRATFTVHRPKQVKGRKGQHSIGQIAVGDTDNRAFVEAGWRTYLDGPRLFVSWRHTKRTQRLCADMGNGKRAKRLKAAKVTGVRFYDGPPVQLSVSPDSDRRNYSVKLTGDTSFRYGGPGRC